jgi:hypothetical protein
MISMQRFGIKTQFLPTSVIFTTPKLAVRSLDDVRLAKLDKLRNRGQGRREAAIAIS